MLGARIYPKAIALFATLLFVMVLVIVALEAYVNYVRPSMFRLDDKLGWKVREWATYTGTHKRLNETLYKVVLTTNEIGLRVIGQPDKALVRILILGDSFTMDPYVSNEDTWYATGKQYVEDRSGLRSGSVYIMAGGGGGYGTFQNYLLLQEIKNKAHPDIFVLQFCPNDFLNNHLAWESHSILRSQFMRRPYYNVDGLVRYSDHPFAWFWRNPLIGTSWVFNKIDGLLQQWQYRHYGSYVKTLDPELESAYESEAAQITSKLLTLMRQEVAGLPAFLVNCDGELNNLNGQWQVLAREAGFTPLSSASGAMTANKTDKTLFNIDGAHWSPEGNNVFGQEFGKDLVETGVISRFIERKITSNAFRGRNS